MASKSAARLTVKDRGFAELMAMAKRLNLRPKVKAGFLAETNTRGATVKKGRKRRGQVVSRGGAVGMADKISNAELAIILHYGTGDGGTVGRGRIPPRPFMRITAQKQRRSWRRLLFRLGREVLKRKLSLEEALRQVGERAVRDIKRTMRTGMAPNAPSTLDEKPGSTPLVATKDLIESVTHKVLTR